MNITKACFANHSPDKIALILLHDVEEAHSWSYAELYERIRKLSAGLKKMHLKPFSRLLIRSENSLDFLLLYFAAMHASLVPCALDPTLTLHEVLLSIQEAKPVLYYESQRLALRPLLPKYCKMLTKEDLEDLKESKEEEEPMSEANDPAFLVFTAGTTAEPKGVIHGHRTVMAREVLRREWLDLQSSDRIFHTESPSLLYTMGVNFFDPWMQGATAISFLGEVTPEKALKIIEKYEVSLFASIPTFYKEMIRLPKHIRERFTQRALRAAFSAEEPLPAVVQEEFESIFNIPLLQGFTMTEMHLPLFDAAGAPRKHGSIGKIHKQSTIAIVPVGERELEPVPQGEKGLLALPIEDPGFMLGTTEREKNHNSFRGKWYITGDIVAKDEEGYFWHYGRTGDILKTVGAVRVSAQEIEAVFRHNQYVSEVAAVTTPNEKGEEILTLFVVPYQIEEEENILEKRLTAYAKKELSSLKIPERIVFLEHLPKNPNGTIDRNTLHFL
jgi:acyl-coenzyme A synthetase/AMP-(fatty) acid ligase